MKFRRLKSCRASGRRDTEQGKVEGGWSSSLCGRPSPTAAILIDSNPASRPYCDGRPQLQFRPRYRLSPLGSRIGTVGALLTVLGVALLQELWSIPLVAQVENAESVSASKLELRRTALQQGVEGDASEARASLTDAVRSARGTGEWSFEYGGLLLQLAVRQVDSRRLEEGEATARMALAQYQNALLKTPGDDLKQQSMIQSKIAFIQGHFLGDREAAILNHQRALEIDGANEHSKRALRRVEGIRAANTRKPAPTDDQ